MRKLAGESPGVDFEAGALSGASLLAVTDLRVAYVRPGGDMNPVVWDVSFTLKAGTILGITGESGCGKSTMALSAIGFRPNGARILGGTSKLGDSDLLTLPDSKLRRLWGSRVAYVSQDASSALNPSLTIGHQLAEPLMEHVGLQRDALKARQVELLAMVGLPDPLNALKRYAHQFSGGQQQRVLIAIALSCRPSVLILDEPTTGLDVTTQAVISRLIRELVSKTGVAALFVSHNLALLATFVDRLAVMYAGEIVEEGPVSAIVEHPGHPYTQALLQAHPSTHNARRLVGIAGHPPATVILNVCSFLERCPHALSSCQTRVQLRSLGTDRTVRCVRANELHFSYPDVIAEVTAPGASATPLLEVENLWCAYPKAESPAVKGVSFALGRAEAIGIVGESGSGKSTLLRALIGLTPPRSGHIRFRGTVLARKAAARPRQVRQAIQLVFQNPDSSLNPRETVIDLIMRPITLFRPDVPRSKRVQAVVDLIAAVKLPKAALHAYPTQLSGGQRQRVAIARAFAARPALLLCDEVTSSLDVSVQATIIDLIADLAVQFGTAVIAVSHDFGVVRALATRVIVMKDGEACEQGMAEQILDSPKHAYTQRLVDSIPDLHWAGKG